MGVSNDELGGQAGEGASGAARQAQRNQDGGITIHWEIERLDNVILTAFAGDIETLLNVPLANIFKYAPDQFQAWPEGAFTLRIRIVIDA